MSPLLILIVSVSLLILLSQLGRKLSARSSPMIWLVSAFLFAATIDPSILRDLADLLQIELVSNFVLASLIFLLFWQSFQSEARIHSQYKKIVDSTTTQAARAFVEVFAQRAPKCLVVIPCYNEQANIPDLIQSLKAELSNRQNDIAYLVVNDGSTDESSTLLDTLAPQNHTDHLTNVGVSGVLQTGFKVAKKLKCTHVIQCDADGQHPIEEIPTLLSQAQANQSDLTIGSRFVTGAPQANHASTTRLRRFGSSLIRVTLALFGPKAAVADPTSGFRVYGEKAYEVLLKNLPEDYPEPESIAILASKSLSIHETPIMMKPRQGGVSSISGVKQASYMIKVISALFGLRLRSIWK